MLPFIIIVIIIITIIITIIIVIVHVTKPQTVEICTADNHITVQMTIRAVTICATETHTGDEECTKLTQRRGDSCSSTTK